MGAAQGRTVISLIAPLLGAISTAVGAATITLVWDAPAGYLPAGYVVGYGEASGAYSTTVDVGSAKTYRVDDLQPGQRYYFSVRAYTGQQSSAWAGEVEVAVLADAPPPSASVSPAVGLWDNPSEPGTGFALDFKHGVLVVTVLSYKLDGSAQWYLASGPLAGTTFDARLEKFAGGQCIGCAYAGQPTAGGTDGTIRIVFSSARSATVYLPGGRVSEIRPLQF